MLDVVTEALYTIRSPLIQVVAENLARSERVFPIYTLACIC
jgi:hypothetical protein